MSVDLSLNMCVHAHACMQGGNVPPQFIMTCSFVILKMWKKPTFFSNQHDTDPF